MPSSQMICTKQRRREIRRTTEDAQQPPKAKSLKRTEKCIEKRSLWNLIQVEDERNELTGKKKINEQVR